MRGAIVERCMGGGDDNAPIHQLLLLQLLEIPNCAPSSRCFRSHSPGQGSDAWGQHTGRGVVKNKTEPEGQCNRGRETQIFLCSNTSCELNPQDRLGKSCVCGIPEWTTSVSTSETSVAFTALDVVGKYTWESGQVRVWAGLTVPKTDPETYLEVLEGLLGRRPQENILITNILCWFF